ncbi:hypothetical protein TNCV_602921 [Trichonephila clavipes]|nr:hypothetical protein TNCV_602921 [Trichonephila clavipes]
MAEMWKRLLFYLGRMQKFGQKALVSDLPLKSLSHHLIYLRWWEETKQD